MNQHGLPAATAASGRGRQQQQPQQHYYKQASPTTSLEEGIEMLLLEPPWQGAQYPPTDLADLVNLVSVQQSTLYSQQAEIKQVRKD